MVPERFAPFFEHRSISTNSTGAVKTHLTDADASLDQKQPFYTAASFVLIHVPLLRDWLLFYLPTSKPQLSWSLLRTSHYFARPIVWQGVSKARPDPKYKYNETKMVPGIKQVRLTWSHFAEFEFSWRPVSQRVSGAECAMGGEGYSIMHWGKGKIFHPCVYRVERLGYWDLR